MVASSDPTQRMAGGAAEEAQGPSVSNLANDLKVAFAEFGEYAKYLVSLEMDNAKMMAKKTAFYAVLGVIGLAVLVGFLAVGTGLLLVGIAGLIGYALGNFWLGATIVGLLMFILPALGAWIGWNYLNKSAYKALRLKYADRRQRQKHQFGRDIKEVANG